MYNIVHLNTCKELQFAKYLMQILITSPSTPVEATSSVREVDYT